MQVATATLALLRRACESGPLLVIVDDFHWLDHASARVLGVVARRLGEMKVAPCCAVRPGEDRTLAETGMPKLEMPLLEADAAERLLDARFPVLASRVRSRLLADAQGNPLVRRSARSPG